jgi:hypothetical protein
MISQLEFDPSDYHLRIMIEDMERDGRSEHAIEDAVRAASALDSTGEARATKNGVPANRLRGSNRLARRLRLSPRAGSAARCRW